MKSSVANPLWLQAHKALQMVHPSELRFFLCKKYELLCRSLHSNKWEKKPLHLLFQERKINQKLWAVHHTLKVEVILASKNWKLFLVFKCDVINFISKRIVLRLT